MPRRVYLLGLGLALVALAFALTDALPSEPGGTAASVRHIRLGFFRRASSGGPLTEAAGVHKT
jgi:hypothetical protein